MGNEETVNNGFVERTIPGWGSVEFGRRLALKGLGATALVGGIEVLAKASEAAAATKSKTIKIGYVTPSTGPLADFAGPDKFVISLIRASSQFAKGMTIGGTKYKIQVIVKDSQSNPSIAGQVTTQLIQAYGVDVVVTSSAPETTIPVSVVWRALSVDGVPVGSLVGRPRRNDRCSGPGRWFDPEVLEHVLLRCTRVRRVLLTDVGQGPKEDEREPGLRGDVPERL
jgi:hypothetical protein